MGVSADLDLDSPLGTLTVSEVKNKCFRGSQVPGARDTGQNRAKEKCFSVKTPSILTMFEELRNRRTRKEINVQGYGPKGS